MRTSDRALVPAVLAVALVAAQICYPLTQGGARDRVTVVVVLLAAATALAHAARTRGSGYAAGFLVIVSGLGLLAEVIGTATGFPFGCYDYAVDRLGPALAGVPLIVPLAWTGGLYPVWIVAGLLARTVAARIGLTAVGAVGWDLFLDPQMVADGQWRWCDAGSGLPGLEQIPLTNYAGWFAVGLVMAGLLAVLERGSAHSRAASAGAQGGSAHSPAAARPEHGGAHSAEVARPEHGSVRSAEVIRAEHSSAHSAGGAWARGIAGARDASVAVPVAVFLWTWLGSALAHAVFLGLPASAAYGALGMGLLGIPLLGWLARYR
ncbi:carotenoid biosynthesis protein [Nocardia sp. NPDC050712]|uniref:carotenoid biosynthesis protein n=1 Tax=Nocardia sp. NPDC050712 TaxID=3155518 RepID=UPI0033CE8392